MQEGRRAARAFHLGQAEARKATLVGMALLGYQTREIAAQTNLSPTTVSHYLAELRRSGELTAGLEHSMQRFRDEAIPLAMDNAIQKLIDGDDKATWKTLDGAGITASKDKSGHVPVLPALTLNVINVPQGPAPTFGQTVGVPHPIDVEPGNGT